MEDLIFDGTSIRWHGKGKFRATSGMRGFQLPSNQCIPERGPVPEGNYYIPLIMGDKAEDDGTGKCQLKPSWRVEKIPRGMDAGNCDRFWANWGENRVRFEPNDQTTKQKCNPGRGGFYLHDSTKGYSHGCIEIENSFFNQLRQFMTYTAKKKLILKIAYKPGTITNGGTKR